jgi:hypothetical protein
MGFHVHIDVSSWNIEQLVKICQNFIKYEDAMDVILPPSRRTNSMQCNQYFRSNRQAMNDTLHLTTNQQRHDALQRCYDIHSLANVMNPGRNRYHKLNLQNLVDGRQPTIEFRQHSSTQNFSKIASWVRFCCNFVRNSAETDSSPTPFHDHGNRCPITRQFEVLFHKVIKDRALNDFYRSRKREFEVSMYWNSSSTFDNENHVCGCCNNCSRGGACARKH